MDPLAFATTGLFGLIAFSIAAAWVTARTAKSKGYRFGWFYVFSLVSWYITAIVVVFIRPKGDKTAKAKLSSVVLLTIGTIVEFTGLSMLPDAAPTLTDQQLLELFASKSSIGAIAVALAGALIAVAGVANDRRASAQPVGAN